MKVNLTEREIRAITRKVILRNELIFEEAEPKGTPAPAPIPGKPEPAVKKKTAEKPKEKKEKPKKKTEFEDLVKSGNADNLATKTSGRAERAVDVVAGSATAAGVAYGTLMAYTGVTTGLAGVGASGVGFTGAASLAGMPTLKAIGAGLVSGPVGWGVLATAAGVGLYYMFAPETTGSDALKEALDTTLYKRVAAGFTKIYDQLRKSEFPEIRELADSMNPKKCLDVPNSAEASKIAEKIYTATQGGSLTGAFTGGAGLFGMGTDEAAIEQALKQCKSYLGVSRVSYKHAKMYEGTFFDDGDLLKVFTGELDNADMERYVNSVIDSLPYIIINEKAYSKEEFQDWLTQSKDLTDKMLEEMKNVQEAAPEAGGEEGVSDTEPLKPPYVKQIQRLINEYCTQKGIDFTRLAEDNKWGPRTTALWKNKYLPHVFANHPIFKTMGLKIGDGKWSGISAQLSEKYPGYTSGEKGCVRFCIDALYGNTIKGEETDKSDSEIKYFGGGSGGTGSRKTAPGPDVRDDPQPAEKKNTSRQQDFTPSDGRLTYKNIKIDVDIVGDRGIRKLSQLRGAASDADDELKYDFLTNFGTGRLDLPVGETFQIHVTPKKNGKIKLQHKSTKLFKARGIRTFAEPFHRFFKSLALSDAEIKRLKIDKSSPIIIKVIMPPGLYNPAVER